MFHADGFHSTAGYNIARPWWKIQVVDVFSFPPIFSLCCAVVVVVVVGNIMSVVYIYTFIFLVYIIMACVPGFIYIYRIDGPAFGSVSAAFIVALRAHCNHGHDRHQHQRQWQRQRIHRDRQAPRSTSNQRPSRSAGRLHCLTKRAIKRHFFRGEEYRRYYTKWWITANQI